MRIYRSKKRESITSDDIRVNRGVITKITVMDITNPQVIQINFSFIAIPKTEKRPVEYERSIESIKTNTKQLLISYILQNRDLFNRRHIMELNFSSANLKKGYNKSVKFTLYLKQNIPLDFKELQSKIKTTIKKTVGEITDTIREYGFICSKKKIDS